MSSNQFHVRSGTIFTGFMPTQLLEEPFMFWRDARNKRLLLSNTIYTNLLRKPPTRVAPKTPTPSGTAPGPLPVAQTPPADPLLMSGALQNTTTAPINLSDISDDEDGLVSRKTPARAVRRAVLSALTTRLSSLLIPVGYTAYHHDHTYAVPKEPARLLSRLAGLAQRAGVSSAAPLSKLARAQDPGITYIHFFPDFFTNGAGLVGVQVGEMLETREWLVLPVAKGLGVEEWGEVEHVYVRAEKAWAHRHVWEEVEKAWTEEPVVEAEGKGKKRKRGGEDKGATKKRRV